jgi:O-antigen ligase
MSDAVRTSSSFAVGVLVTLVVLSPWPFGSVHPATHWLIAVVCLLTSAGIALVLVRRGEGIEIPQTAVFAVAIFLLGLVQLVPLPPGVHAVLAPGSAALWHPEVPAPASVLGKVWQPVSIWPEATRRAVGFGLGVVAIATLAIPALRDRGRAFRAVSIVVCSAVAVALYSLVARLVFGDKLFGVLTVPTVAPFGPFVSKNHFAGFVEMGALLALGLAAALGEDLGRTDEPLGWLDSRRAGPIVFGYGAAAALGLSVLVSLSRGGALSLAAGGAAFVAMRSFRAGASVTRWRARALPIAMILAVALAAFFIMPADARVRLHTLADGREDLATAYRIVVWGDGIRLAAASPLLGHGLGTFVDALPRFKTGGTDLLVGHAENDYIELLAESGVIGLGLLCAALVTLFRSLGRVRGRRIRGSALAQGAAAGLVALATHSLVDFNVRIPSNTLLGAFLAAVLIARSPRSRSGRFVSYGLVTLSLSALLLMPWRPMPPQVALPGEAPALRAPDGPGSLRHTQLQEALRDHLRGRPADAEAWVWLGWSRSAVGATEQGCQLATYGAALDPQRTALRALTERRCR